MTIQTKKLSIGSLGAFDLTLPLIEISSDVEGPRIVFIANQHGNEITPLFVLQELVEALKQTPLQSGSIRIITTANPLGLLFGTREEPLDGDNLNRSFPGSLGKNLGKRIASAVFKEARKADLVVDLHTFSRQCPSLGIFVKTDDVVERACRKALQTIAPDCIWQVDMDREADMQFVGALDLQLVRKQIPAISLEMEQHRTISPEGISRVTQSLLRLLASHGMVQLKSSPAPPKDIPVFVSHYLFFDESGIFSPKRKVFDEIKEGDRLGTVTNIRTFQSTPVYAPVSGTLLTIRFRDFVRTGSKLGSIGKQVDAL